MFDIAQPVGVLFPEGDYLFRSQLSSVTSVLSVGLRPHGLFPVQFGVSFGILLVQVVFGWSCCWDITDISSRHTSWEYLMSAMWSPEHRVKMWWGDHIILTEHEISVLGTLLYCTGSLIPFQANLVTSF